MADLNKYVGIPWKEHSSSFEGCDCWGLVALVLREEKGIEIPLFHHKYDTLVDRKAIRALIREETEEFLTDWIQIPWGNERDFDGVMMTLGGFPQHVGIVQKPGFLLHVDFGMTDSICEPYRNLKFRNRIEGFYRHKSLV